MYAQLGARGVLVVQTAVVGNTLLLLCPGVYFERTLRCATVPCIRVLEVVLHWTDDVADPQHAVSSDALRRLAGFTDSRGRKIKVGI